MGLMVRSNSGKKYRRAGMRFGEEWTEVSNAKLAETQFGRGPDGFGDHTVKDILLTDRMLTIVDKSVVAPVAPVTPAAPAAPADKPVKPDKKG